MENSKGRGKSKTGGKPTGPDLRQMDLWNAAQAAAAAATSAAISKPPEASNAPLPKTVEPARTSAIAKPGASTPKPPALTAQSVSRARSTPTSAVLPPPRATPALTRRQQDLLDYLAEREQNGQRPPSLTEICRDLGLVSRGSLHKQITALVEARLVEPMNGKQRGVRLLRASNDETRLPLLGAIAAGRPIEALTRDESVSVPGWLRTGGDCYALRVRGDSMRDVGILDGDIVVIESRQTAKNGELVVALVDNSETTLKRIEQKPGEVLLHAENPAYAPQRYVPDRVTIQGVVVGSIRRY